MERDRYIDPVTGDFEAAPGGGFRIDDVLLNKITLSFRVPRGSWEGDPALGHRLAELARERDTPQVRRRLRELALEALQWLLDSGELERVDIDVESHAPGIVAWQVTAVPPQGDPLQVGPFLLQVGR